MLQPGQKVVRKEDEERNKKWPEKWLHKPVKILSVSGDRIRFSDQDYPELVNHKGWVASRFIPVDHPDYRPFKRFL